MSPTARTLKLLREQGYLAGVVERYTPFSHTRHDLYGFADIAAVHPAWPGTLYVQATSGSNHASRRVKLAALSAVEVVKAAGNRIQIVSWSKRAKTRRWTARIEEL